MFFSPPSSSQFLLAGGAALVAQLTRTFAPNTLLAHASEVDAGFDRSVLAAMIGYIDRYTDADLELGNVDVPALRAFFAEWRAQLLAHKD